MLDLAIRPPHVPEDRVVDFDVYNPPSFQTDFHAAWKALQSAETPDVVWSPYHGGHWIGTRARVVEQIYSNYELFSNRVGQVPKASGEELQMIPHGIDPPEHRPYRMRLNAVLSPKRVSEMVNEIRALSVSLIEAVRLKGKCDFTTDYAQVLPVHIFLEMMELPAGDAPMLRTWVDWIARPTPSNTTAAAIANFHEYLGRYIDERMNKGGDDMLSRVINGEVAGKALTREEAVRMATLVLFGGLDTVVGALSFSMLFLARNPDRRRELQNDPSLIPSAVEELLRRFPLVTNVREVTHDVCFGGVELKKGEMICTPNILVGLDGDANERPMEVDFHRPTTEHLTFGLGHHRCPGAHLGRTELRVTLEEWLARIPEFEVEAGQDISFSAGIVASVNALPLTWQV